MALAGDYEIQLEQDKWRQADLSVCIRFQPVRFSMNAAAEKFHVEPDSALLPGSSSRSNLFEIASPLPIGHGGIERRLFRPEEMFIV